LAQVSVDVNKTCCYPLPVTQAKTKRDYLLRGLPIELAEKLKAAAGIHRKPSLREYILHVLAVHVKDLERKGYTLNPKGKF
jgi:hypothetical protein